MLVIAIILLTIGAARARAAFRALGETETAARLPAGADWYDFHTGERFKGGAMRTVQAPRERMPLFVKAGSVNDGAQAGTFIHAGQTLTVPSATPGAAGNKPAPELL